MNPQEQAYKTVMVFGTFDVFHLGHEYFLKQAKALGDYLIAVIARDKTVKKVKGEYPQHNEKLRMENVKNSGIPDKVVLGNFDDKYKIIKKLKPKIIALGYDQFVFTYKLNKMIIDEKMDTEIIRLESFEPNLYKSSFIKSTNEEDV
jgi:FAD synthetase